jgi:S-formylglutathione hydrolase FrmB
MAYCLILPRDYARTQDSYPVLYLLHGLWGSENDWTARTNVGELLGELPLIVVMPQADDGWYTNSARIPAAKYEDYLLNDVVGEIDSHYRTIRSRQGRFVAGLSMGGYGAVKAALRHPEMFSAVGGFSGVYHATRSARFQTLSMAFGPTGDPSRKENDDFALLAGNSAAVLPYFFIMTGANDSLVLEDNHDLLAALAEKRATYEYHEIPGGHEWPVWQKCLRMFLDVIRPQLRTKMG